MGMDITVTYYVEMPQDEAAALVERIAAVRYFDLVGPPWVEVMAFGAVVELCSRRSIPLDVLEHLFGERRWIATCEDDPCVHQGLPEERRWRTYNGRDVTDLEFERLRPANFGKWPVGEDWPADELRERGIVPGTLVVEVFVAKRGTPDDEEREEREHDVRQALLYDGPDYVWVEHPRHAERMLKLRARMEVESFEELMEDVEEEAPRPRAD